MYCPCVSHDTVSGQKQLIHHLQCVFSLSTSPELFTLLEALANRAGVKELIFTPHKRQRRGNVPKVTPRTARDISARQLGD